jgi:hypothetical protein
MFRFPDDNPARRSGTRSSRVKMWIISYALVRALSWTIYGLAGNLDSLNAFRVCVACHVCYNSATPVNHAENVDVSC